MNTFSRLFLSLLAASTLCHGQPVISTVAGNGTIGYFGDGGPAINAGLKLPTDMAIDGAGNIYIADYGNNVVRKVDTTGKISTFAGNGTADYAGVADPAPGDGGPATSAEIPFPTSVAVDKAGNVFIANVGAVRKIDTSGNISTAVALSGAGLAFDSAGNLYITDTNGTAIHKLSPGGYSVWSRAALSASRAMADPLSRRRSLFPPEWQLIPRATFTLRIRPTIGSARWIARASSLPWPAARASLAFRATAVPPPALN
ncbi:MAG TPA: hypothetical protein VKV15_03855 [Bryobacteraceae bacterium]|nr:hypothetical protein [Bryobacteraceae bacterium]